MEENVSSTTLATMNKGFPMPDEMFMRLFLSLVKGWCTVFCLPVECLIRPAFSTRYFLPPSFVFAWVWLQIATIISWFPRYGGQIVPFIGPVTAPVDMSNLLLVFNVACLWHLFRCWKRVVNMHLEIDSEWEGEPWRFYKELPKGKWWSYQRIVYEPASVLLAVTMLYKTGIISGVATLYLTLGALCLFVKAMLTYYEGWQYVRIGHDAEARKGLIAAIRTGKSSVTRVGNIIMESLQHMTPEVQAAVIEQQLPPELASMVSQPERHQVTTEHIDPSGLAKEGGNA